MNNLMWTNSILELINKLETMIKTQENMDILYGDMCDLIFKELDRTAGVKNSKHRKKF